MESVSKLNVAAALRERLASAFEPLALDIRDDSAAHHGHAGAAGGGHYAVRVVSARFAGLPLLARHRLVYTAVTDLLQNGIHALAIDALSPSEITSK